MGEAVADFGQEHVSKFVNYHRKNGGVSRYKKFDYFLQNIVGQPDARRSEMLVSKYGDLVRTKLLAVSYTDGLLDFLDYLKKSAASVYIVSGGDQEELRDVFPKRGLGNVFSDIFGSPVEKHQHCQHIKSLYSDDTPILFIGDSQLDHEAARDNGFDFLFLSRYTDFDLWEAYCTSHEISHTPDLATWLNNQPI